jgi:hypothetical protein
MGVLGRSTVVFFRFRICLQAVSFIALVVIFGYPLYPFKSLQWWSTCVLAVLPFPCIMYFLAAWRLTEDWVYKQVLQCLLACLLLETPWVCRRECC